MTTEEEGEQPEQQQEEEVKQEEGQKATHEPEPASEPAPEPEPEEDIDVAAEHKICIEARGMFLGETSAIILLPLAENFIQNGALR